MSQVRSDGPFVNVATLCRARHRQPDDTVDLIGVVRQAFVMDSAFLDRVEPSSIRLVAVVTLDGGNLRGAYPLALQTVFPGGTEGKMFARLVEFSDESPQVTMEVPLVLEVDQPGEYGVEVRFDQRLLTKMIVRASRSAFEAGAPSNDTLDPPTTARLVPGRWPAAASMGVETRRSDSGGDSDV